MKVAKYRDITTKYEFMDVYHGEASFPDNHTDYVRLTEPLEVDENNLVYLPESDHVVKAKAAFDAKIDILFEKIQELQEQKAEYLSLAAPVEE